MVALSNASSFTVNVVPIEATPVETARIAVLEVMLIRAVKYVLPKTR